MSYSGSASAASQAMYNNTTATSNKQRQLHLLAQQLSVLSDRVAELDRLTITTSEQAKFMRSLAGYHAAWFMSANRILTPADVPPPNVAQD
ncbi:hypothetical protein OIV83_000589 [Microbotryomycetes sp. JL201]|nr:hypothetical protein OIV83_000589 [Microbotryomycetes sp. JL201]